jgi:predicted dehydrogenase
MKPVRIAVVGGGVYGSQMLNCFAAAQRRGQAELVALVDLDDAVLDRHESTSGIKGYKSLDAMLGAEALDAIAIATPDHLHLDGVLKGAEAGLHIISQKPLDVRAERVEQMIAACEARNRLLYVDFHKRFDPGHIRLRNDVKAGRLGTVQYGTVHMEDKIVVPTEWLKRWASASSPSWFLGVHFYDLVTWILSSTPVRVYATGQKGKLSGMGIDTWDSIQARVEYANGASINFDLSWILPLSFPSIVNQGIRLVGENGIAEVDSQDRGMFAAYETGAGGSMVINPFGALEIEHPTQGRQLRGYTYESMTYFLDLVGALAEGASLASLNGTYPSANEAIHSTWIGEAVDESLAKRQIVGRS